ncbi:MAG: hypothetical protein PHE03_06910 [Bacteroidales bacterium]|nr:hypothetical protein [Bacteroidales bacterium]
MKNNLNQPGLYEKMYTDICNRLDTLTAINGDKIIESIDLWNNQWAYLASEKPFKFPCIFIEFLDISWQSVGKGQQLGNANVRLHFGSKTNAPSRHKNRQKAEYLKHLRIVDALQELFTGWGFETGYMGSWSRTQTTHDHDHDDIIAHILAYRFTIKDSAGVGRLESIGGGERLLVELETKATEL